MKDKEKLSYQRMRALIRRFILEADKPFLAHVRLSNYLYDAEKEVERRARIARGLTPEPTEEEAAAQRQKFKGLAEFLVGRAVESMGQDG